MKTADLRHAFLDFYESKGHRIVASSSLVPHNDPTLLFTNAGMNQFKDPLLGKSDPGYTRATSAQRCVRAGGKHHDLENVGYTARHHTFFEMMGNFSFGDYFKEDTISWAWEFATAVVGLDPDKILITVHPTDDDSRKIWRDKVGISNERIIDLEENFWTMGDTGPCGPCTELFYDHGPSIAGGLQVHPMKTAIVSSNSRIWCFHNSIAVLTVRWILCLSPGSIREWGLSVWPPFCRACTAITKSICLPA